MTRTAQRSIARYRPGFLTHGLRRRLDRRYQEGIVDAYVELVAKGIREVALPNFGVLHPEEAQWILDKADQAGLCSFLLRHETRRLLAEGGDEFLAYVYQAMLFTPGAEDKANTLKQLLATPGKTSEENRRIGLLLGYRADVVEEFVNRPKRKHSEDVSASPQD